MRPRWGLGGGIGENRGLQFTATDSTDILMTSSAETYSIYLNFCNINSKLLAGSVVYRYELVKSMRTKKRKTKKSSHTHTTKEHLMPDRLDVQRPPKINLNPPLPSNPFKHAAVPGPW